jgi:hypothetical protein
MISVTYLQSKPVFGCVAAGALVLLLGWLLAPLSASADPPPIYNGSYELAGKRTDRDFFLEVRQTGSRAKVNFSASMADGTGAAPDAEGDGRIEDGVLPHGGYQLDMVVTKMVEAAPLHFYGTLLLKKVSDRTITP